MLLGCSALGPSVLQVAQTTKAKGGGRGGIQISGEDGRGKARREYEAAVASKSATKGGYAVAVYAEAAKAGEHATEIDLFKLYDTDHTGELSTKELRKLLGLVRTR
eukprot:SAG31_NODE_10674_length_1111_cov_1.481225_2_plen_106_part_00